MIPSTTASPSALLAQLAQLTSIEFGTLTEEYREVRAPVGTGTVRIGPYYKHQCWEDKKNRSTRVPAECVESLRADLKRGQEFDAITARLRQVAVTQSRAQRAALLDRKVPDDAKKNSTKLASRNATAKRKPASKALSEKAKRKA
jgi:hypothetical protein